MFSNPCMQELPPPLSKTKGLLLSILKPPVPGISGEQNRYPAPFPSVSVQAQNKTETCWVPMSESLTALQSSHLIIHKTRCPQPLARVLDGISHVQTGTPLFKILDLPLVGTTILVWICKIRVSGAGMSIIRLWCTFFLTLLFYILVFLPIILIILPNILFIMLIIPSLNTSIDSCYINSPTNLQIYKNYERRLYCNMITECSPQKMIPAGMKTRNVE